MQSNTYWSNRALDRMKDYHRDGDKVMSTLTVAYNKGAADINKEIEKIFLKFASDGEMTADEAMNLLNEPVNRKEWQELKDKVWSITDPKLRRRVLNRLNAPAYAARISRLEALKANVYLQSKVIADVEISRTTSYYIKTINEAYYKTMFDLQKGINMAFEFNAMPDRVVEEILRNPWSGKHFSERVWHNTDVLAETINEVITAGVKSGASYRQMTREIQERMDVGRYAANRLIRTEITYMANSAEIESYKAAGIKQYIFIATLDLHTSDICQDMDLKVFNVVDAQPNVNLPPMHAFCRSTTIAYISQRALENIKRRARDSSAGDMIVPAGMNYKQWYEKYVKVA